MNGRFLIDTNVLIYATLSSDPRHQQALAVLAARQVTGNSAFVSAQNLAEMYPNLTGPKTLPPDPPELARAKIEALASLDRLTVLPVTRMVVGKALELCESHGVIRQRYFDLQLAALLLLEGIPTLVTENTADFSGIEGIQTINPFD